MASLTDLLSAVQNAVSGINAMTVTAPKFSSLLVGNYYAINNIGTTAQQILTAETSRSWILFHNPSSAVSVMLFPTTDSSGTTLNVTFSSSLQGGGMRLGPSEFFSICGNCAESWRAIASSTAACSLTIATY